MREKILTVDGALAIRPSCAVITTTNAYAIPACSLFAASVRDAELCAERSSAFPAPSVHAAPVPATPQDHA